MVFSSHLFVFLFLPIFLSLYWLAPARLRNAVILAASLLFYFVGEGSGIGVLLTSIAGNYLFGLLIGHAPDGVPVRTARDRRWLVIGLAFNLAMLGWFKYAGFLAANVEALGRALGIDWAGPAPSVILPLGVSFFVFQGMSYLIDVHRGTIRPTANLLTFATYKTLFPQLIAGPIVRYREIAEELRERRVGMDQVARGVTRFTIGFCKKVLIADNVGVVADRVFALAPGELGFCASWFGAIAYTLQIYFDFSAYSDMAIGLALMMGFRFPENFDHPYVARSIREFWRRWHITLSSWFRDYVYVPLGGSRRGAGRTNLNLLVVFLLTGLWHGAAWTFVAWGLWHGLFIVLERATGWDTRAIPRALRHACVLLVVMFGWVLFRADSFAHAHAVAAAMLGFANGAAPALGELADPVQMLAIGAGIVFSLPVYTWVRDRLAQPAAFGLGMLTLGVAFAFACMRVLAGAYSPFLYFRF